MGLKPTLALAVALAVALGLELGLAGPGSKPAAAAPPLRSGFDDMAASSQALQRDDGANPAWLWVQDGQRRFEAECQRCHRAASLRGAAARYPVFDAETAAPLNLAGRIARCQQRHVRASPALAAAPEPADGDAALGLQAYVALQSRGLPLQPDADPRLAAFAARGRALFTQRLGQLDFSCAQCHEQHAGRRLAGAVIPQGHPNGYPLYRLEWQGLGSLQRRLRNCMTGVRAEPYAADSPEFAALEVYLVQRAAGLALETPAVRP